MIYRFTFFAFCFFAFSFFANGQGVNLVPNPGFEERVNCIIGDSSIEDAPPWFNPCVDPFIPATPDLFHECAVVNFDPCPYPDEWYLDLWFYGVPTNTVGCESASEGAGYAGIFVFTQTSNQIVTDIANI